MSRIRVLKGDPDRRRLVDGGDSSSSESSPEDIPCTPLPADRFCFVYFVFFLIGVGSLLPWNFISNAKQYFLFKLRNVTISGTESYAAASFFTSNQVMFETYLELASQIPTVFFVFINMILTKIVSTRLRIVSSICLNIALFIPTIWFTRVDSDTWQHAFLILSLITAVLMNAGGAVLQGAICGLAGMFPHSYMQSVFSGMAFGGLAASLCNLATLAFGPNPSDSGFAFFLVAEFILIGCLIFYLMAFSTPFVKFYTTGHVTTINGVHAIANSDDIVLSSQSSAVPIINTCRAIVSVAKKIWIPALSIFYVFFISLACYPAVLSAIQSNSDDKIWAGKYFTPVVCFVTFNLTDFLGRNMAGVFKKPREASPVFFIVCLLRGLFIPLFLLCNVQPRPQNSYVAFNHDAFPFFLNCLFGLSNGYFATLSMIHAPRLVPEEDFEMAGSMMACFLSLGLTVGAMVSVLLVNAI